MDKSLAIVGTAENKDEMLQMSMNWATAKRNSRRYLRALEIVGLEGIFSLVAGFVNDKIGLIVLRAVVGLCASIFSADFTRANHERWIVAAMSIPSALSLIVHLFPEPADQAHAIAMFAGGGPIGNSKHLLYCHIIPPI